MAFSPLQKSFNAGEISKKLRGQFGTSIYERGLDTCENFIPTPQGPLLMRAGGKDAGGLGVATKPRFIPFRARGEAEDYVLALTDGKVSVFSRATGQIVNSRTQYVTNGNFDFGLEAWTPYASFGSVEVVNETLHLSVLDDPSNPRAEVTQQGATVAGHSYRITMRVRASRAIYGYPNVGGDVGLLVSAGMAGYLPHASLTTQWQTLTMDFVAVGAGSIGIYAVSSHVTLGAFDLYIDNISMVDLGESTAPAVFNAPWTQEMLEGIRYDSEPSKNRIVFVHSEGKLKPQTITYNSTAGSWKLAEAVFVDAPAEWYDGNWPSAVEVGFQGRTWFAATPDRPSTVWYSKSGTAFTFTVGTNAADSNAFIVTTKGAIKWIKGQKRLFAGGETIEHSITGSNKIITPTDVNVEDQSAFGSGAVQGLHIGDQVLWVTRSLRSVRVMNYEQNEDTWVSSAITFICEGMLPNVGIRETHFCRDPIPTLFIVSNDDRLFAATYDRSVQVIAFYRILVGASVATACVADGAAGSELWYAPLRGGTYRVERIAMHEEGVDYLDSWSAVAADGAGVITGLDRFEGQTISVKYTDDEGHILVASRDVVGGSITIEDAAGQTVITGLPFLAKAVTLPLPLKDKKGRYSKIGVLISDSALPKLNGWIPQNDKLAEAPQGLPQELRSGKFSAANEGTDDEAKIAITQDLPYRTEVLALYGVAEG